MDNKPTVSEKDRRLISFFLSVIVLSAIFSFIGDITHSITHNMFMTTSTINGMVSDYTSDSVYVFIDWTLEYEHTIKFTETDLLEVKLYVNNLMTKDLKHQINIITYKDFQDISQNKIVLSKNGVTIIMFNNLNK